MNDYDVYDRIAAGNRMRTKREILGQTQEIAADKIGISSVHYGYIERGQKTLTLRTLIAISAHYQTTMDYILFGTNEIPPDILSIINQLDDINQALAPYRNQ